MVTHKQKHLDKVKAKKREGAQKLKVIVQATSASCNFKGNRDGAS